MATPTQYQCFKDIYDREAKRCELLIDRGKLYLSVITIYVGLLGIASKEIIPKASASSLATILYVASLVGFVMALLLLICSTGIYTHFYPTDPIKVIRGFGAEPPTDEDFFDKRIAEIASAFERFHQVNDQRAQLLKYASWFMVLGVASQAYVLSLIIL